MRFSQILFTVAPFVQISFAQIPDRYQYPVFDSVTIQKNIQYGEADFYDANSNHDLAPLHLDFYEPYGDTLSARPLVITIFGGAFLGGNKEWDDMVAWCDSLSRFGYACASIQYRLLFNPANQESIIRASYRAVQDTRAAIRFMTANAENYRIDTSKIFLIGNSAGSITALLAAFISKDSERPSSSFGSGSASDADDLGCLDCSGNNFNHEVKFAGIISLWGAMWNLNWIEADEKTPALLIHGTMDGTVPFDTGYAFGASLSPLLYGSLPIHREMTRLGIPHEFHPFDSLEHSFYMGNGGFFTMNEYWDPVFTLGHEFLYKIVSPVINYVSDDFANSEVSIYPNPAEGSIFISFRKEVSSSFDCSITNMQGKKIQFGQVSSQNTTLDISAIPRGIYLLIAQSSKIRFTEKIVIY